MYTEGHRFPHTCKLADLCILANKLKRHLLSNRGTDFENN